jgi:hypothetical protein
MDGAIFLSAGIPDPSANHFIAPADAVAISSAVSALLHVTLGRRRLVWGGHPSITPMVWAFAEAMGISYDDWVLLYQSTIFKKEFPKETRLFHNVVRTRKVGQDIPASLTVMRKRMIRETHFGAAVFLGGMQGILDEHRLFAERAPEARIIPVGSTGGAAGVLVRDLRSDTALATNLDYVELFYSQLEIDRNERRYRSRGEQPADPAARLERPGRAG